MTTTVHIEGDVLEGWEGLNVSRSIEDAVSTASFTAPLRWPRDPNPTRIRTGSLVQVYDDDDQMFYGYADAMTPNTDENGTIVSVDARSATADLVDCPVITEPYSWQQMTMLDIAIAIAAPYQVSIIARTVADDVIGKPIDFRAELGEPVFECIERLAQSAGVLVTDDGEGRIVLTKSQTAFGMLDAIIGLPVLEVGVNVENPSATFRHDQRYSEYRVYGQRPGGNADYGNSVALQRAIVVDPEVERYRVLTIMASQRATLQQLHDRAVWEAVTRAGQSVSASYDVVGWRRPDGKLWAPGQLVIVKDPIRAINATMVISAVNWGLATGGRRASLSVAPPEGFELMPTIKDPVTEKQKLSKPVTPGEKYGPWLTADQVAAIVKESGG